MRRRPQPCLKARATLARKYTGVLSSLWADSSTGGPKQRRQLKETQDLVAKNQRELDWSLNATRDELNGSIAKTHEELVALAKRGERTYFEFDLAKSKEFQRFGPLPLSLRKADMPVRIGHAERAPITASISTNGKVEPVKNFEAHAPGPAIVKRVLVREGDRVKAGQLLVQLDDAEARASAARAMAQLRNAEADLFAIQKGGTHEEVLTTQSQLAKAQTELDAAQRNYEALQRLQKTGAASPAEVQEAQNRLQRAQADAQLLQQKQQQQ